MRGSRFFPHPRPSPLFVIEARQEPLAYDRDHVVLLSDWLHGDPYRVLAKLRGGSAKSAERPSAPMGVAMPDRPAMSGMSGMNMGADLSDVKYDAFLLNGRGNNDPWVCAAAGGDRVRLRLVNASASTFFRFTRYWWWPPMVNASSQSRSTPYFSAWAKPTTCWSLPAKAAHTVSVAPGATAAFEFVADNPGQWFFHCHNLYHLKAGMARAWIYQA